MHFHINSVTGIWIGNYNHLVSSSCNIPQFPHFGGYTKILTEIGRSPFHHTFTESSRLTQQSISRVDCHFFPSCHFTFSTTQGGGGGGGEGGGPGGGPNPPPPPPPPPPPRPPPGRGPNLPPPTSCALHSQLALSILPLASLALFRLQHIKHRCVIFL